MVDKAVLGAVAEILRDERKSVDEKIGAVKDEMRALIPDYSADFERIERSVAGFAEAADIRHAELDAEIDAISKKLIELSLEGTDEAIEKAVADSFRGATALLDKYASAASERLDTFIGESTKQIDARLAEVKDGKDGQDGQDGRDGVDGIDRQLVQPSFIDPDAQVPKGTVVYHNGGLFQSTRSVTGDPDRDPHGWSCVVDGIDALEQGFDAKTGEHVLFSRLASGEKHEHRFQRAPSYLPPGDHKSIEGDFYVQDSVFKVFVGDEWLEVDIRGEKGEPGIAGKDGKRGLRGHGVVDAFFDDDWTLHLELSSGKFLEVKTGIGDQIKTMFEDIAFPEQPDIDQEIRRYAGQWHTSKSYKRGDVVTAYDGLWLALKNTGKQPNDIDSDWVLMHSGGGGGGGGGGGNALPAITTLLQNKYVAKTSLVTASSGAATANQIPQLNANGKLDGSFLAIPGGMTLKGSVDATVTPPATLKAGDYYIASADGTLHAGYGLGAITVKKGDTLLYSGTAWIHDQSQVDLSAVYTKTQIDAKLASFAGGLNFLKITAAAYNALAVKDPKTLYLVSG